MGTRKEVGTLKFLHATPFPTFQHTNTCGVRLQQQRPRPHGLGANSDIVHGFALHFQQQRPPIPTVAKLVKKFINCHETGRCITLCLTLPPSQSRQIQPTPSHQNVHFSSVLVYSLATGITIAIFSLKSICFKCKSESTLTSRVSKNQYLFLQCRSTFYIFTHARMYHAHTHTAATAARWTYRP